MLLLVCLAAALCACGQQGVAGAAAEPIVEETPEPTAAPEESPAPTEAPAEEKAEETPRPEQPAEEKPEADTEGGDTSAEPETAEGKRGQTGALAWALAGVAVLTGGGWLLAKRKKTED